MIHRPTALLLLSLISTGWAHAELVLETPVIEVRPKPEDETATITFTFRNSGTRTVNVLSVDSSCSCLSAGMDKTVYAPGEQGVGKAEFKVSAITGQRSSSLQVQTDDPAQPQWTIPFNIIVPEIIKIEPKTLQWWLGDEPQEKTARVIIGGEQPIRITGISSTRENIEFRYQEIEPGRVYEVTMKPKNTEEVMLGALRIETDSSIPKYQRQLAFFSVYRKPANLDTTTPAAPAP